jgi:hypothetical protein
VPWQDGVHYGQAVAARSGRGMGVDVPAQAKAGNASLTSCAFIPPSSGTTWSSPAARIRDARPNTTPLQAPNPASPPRTLPAWRRSSPGSPPKAGSLTAAPRNGAKGRWREAAEGTLDPAYSHGLARVPGWAENRRETEDEARWHHRLAQLVDFRQEGNDGPRHKDCDSEREHTLGVWIHTQRYKNHRNGLDPAKVKLLDVAVPDWQAGRTRGRPPRR